MLEKEKIPIIKTKRQLQSLKAYMIKKKKSFNRYDITSLGRHFTWINNCSVHKYYAILPCGLTDMTPAYVKKLLHETVAVQI